MTTRTVEQIVSDVVRVAVIEAMRRRAEGQQGLTLDLLEQRIEHWVAITDDPLVADHAADAPQADCDDRDDVLEGLTALVERLGSMPSMTHGYTPVTLTTKNVRTGSALPAALNRLEPTAPLKAVGAFRETWQRLRADQRLRQALALVPAQAGPLNSAHLVHRALQDLRDLSPAYLDALLSHLDALLWLEESGAFADQGGRHATAKTRMPV